jgi:hypothetical protein
MSSELFRDTRSMQESWGGKHSQNSLEINCGLGTPDERAQRVRQIRVLHPSYQKALEFVKGTYEKYSRFNDPGGGRIIAEGGCGKSSICHYMLELHPPDDLPDRLSLPILAIDAFPGARLGSLIDMMLGRCSFVLARANISNSDRSITGKIKTLVSAVKRCDVHMFMIDEFQHVGERKVGVHTKELTDGFKTIYNATGIPHIFLGESPANLAFEQNNQFATRFPGKVDIPIFDMDSIFLGVLQGFDAQLPMEYQAGLASPDIAYALHVATAGRMRLLVKIIAESVYFSSSSGALKIGVAHLSAAYDSVFGKSLSGKNPFTGLKDF